MATVDSAISLLPDRPGSLNQLKKLGRAIRDDDAEAIASLHYNDVWNWYNELVGAAVTEIDGLDYSAVLGSPPLVSGRAKVRETVRDKLRRRPAEQLPSLQDLAGVRVEADMTLDQQDAVAAVIIEHFGTEVCTVHDLRDGSHAGYRGLHVWVRLKAPRGAWIEVQVRTALQGEWANTYEMLGDLVGREIRYGQMPRDSRTRALVRYFQFASRVQLADSERAENAFRRWLRGKLSTEDFVASFASTSIDPEGFGAALKGASPHEIAVTSDMLAGGRSVAIDMLRRAQSELRSMSAEGR